MAENKTKQTTVDPEEYIALLPAGRRRDDATRLLQIMREATGDDAVMWGPSMIGFGSFHYRYASGHEGDSMKVGFAPRASAIVLYCLLNHETVEGFLAKLGKFTRSKGCVYVKKLDDIDEDVLRDFIRFSYDNAEGSLDS